MPEKLNPSGTFGAAPAHAPHEVAQPIHPDVVAEMVSLARAHDAPHDLLRIMTAERRPAERSRKVRRN